MFETRPGSRWRDGGRTRPLAVVLLLTVSLSLWLGYEAYDAARSHRTAVEATLRDYTGMAARELSRLSRESLHWFVDETFDEFRHGGRNGTRPSLEEIGEEMAEALRWRACDCPGLGEPLGQFRIDHSPTEVALFPDTFPAAVGSRVVRALEPRVTDPSARRRGVLLAPAGSVLDRPVAIGYSVRRADDGAAAVTHGFIVPTEALGGLIGHWYGKRPLLPRSVGRTAANDSLLHVRVQAPDGMPLLVSNGEYRPGLASHDTVAEAWGGLGVEVNVRSSGASELVAGGLPPSRTPLFLGMLALVVLLGVTGLVQIRREEELARLRDDFVSGVSHELRTPLAQIRMFAELQSAGKLRSEEERSRAVTVIDREARRLSHLVENVLRFSQLRRPVNGDRPRRAVPLDDAIDEATEGFRPQLAARDVRICRRTEPELTVEATSGSVRQILVNLLDNAAKYGPRGQTVTLRTERADGHRASGRIRIVVDDEGPGVPKPDRGRIWAPYRRLDRDVRGREPGTGVGLAVVAALARENGGEAWVEDAPGGGARFVVELPAADGSADGARGAPA